MRTWRDLGRAGQALVVGCLVLAAVVVAAVVRLLDRPDPPEAFLERTPELSCGTVEVAHEPPSGPEIACFVEAVRDGADAQVVVRGISQEGGVYRTYYRTIPGGGGLEYFSDSTEDSFGPGRWEHYRCPGARTFLDLGDCREV